MPLGAIAIAMIDRPGQAMREAASRPRGWWLPALLLVIGLATYTLVSVDAQVTLANERTSQMIERITASMSEEQAQMVREGSRPLSRSSYLLSALGGGVATMAIGWLARGALAHFGSMVLGGVSTWGPTFATALWSMVPFLVRDLLMTAVFIVQGRLVEQQGLAFLASSGDYLRDSRSIPVALLSNVDPFVLWHLVLLAFAISASTRVGRSRGAVLAIVIWAILVGVKLVPVAVGAALTGQIVG
jgi:hypothetical protein